MDWSLCLLPLDLLQGCLVLQISFCLTVSLIFNSDVYELNITSTFWKLETSGIFQDVYIYKSINTHLYLQRRQTFTITPITSLLSLFWKLDCVFKQQPGERKQTNRTWWPSRCLLKESEQWGEPPCTADKIDDLTVRAAYLDLTSGKVLWVLRPHMQQPSVCSEGKGMGGMGEPCIFSQTGLSNLEKEIFQQAFAGNQPKAGKRCLQLFIRCIHEKKVGEIFEFHFKMT